MTSTFEAELPLKKIHPHPGNLRRAAIADDDMVASIREHGVFEPAIVAPHASKAGEFVLIAGHRRLDGSTKAKRTSMPAIIRTDLVTEGQQIEAMIIENGHRTDLTPIEEAEGYAQLELLGYKPAQIAAAVGRNVKTVRARLGLLKLSKSTKERVHDGQLSLEDALAIGEFSDDPDTTKALEKAAAGGTLRYELQSARNRRERIQAAAAKIARLAELGAKPYNLPADTPLWKHVQDGKVASVYQEDEFTQHKGCLAYVQRDGTSYPAVDAICTKPAKHATAEDKAEAAERAKREAEREEAEQARQEKADQARAASSARTATLLDLIGTNTKAAPQLVDLIRALLPYLLMHPECEDALQAYQDALDIPADDRWSAYWWGDKADRNRTLAAQHLAELPNISDGRIIRGLVGALIGLAETYLTVWDSAEKIDLQLVGSYYDVLSEAGYVNAPPDVEIQDDLREAWANLESGATDEEKAS